MTEKKKRGLLSWLGFGEEESSKPTTATEQTEDRSVVEETVVEHAETAEIE